MSSVSPTQDSQASNNLGFLKNVSDKRMTRDGQAPKRRGPKPDSRPALTRRQELNRQAQRTHRERKELYIKALEDEVLRLKEIYSSIAQDKERLAEENRQLKQLLNQQGTGATPLGGGSSRGGGNGGGGGAEDVATNPSVGGYSASASGSSGGAAPSSSHTSTYTPSPFGSSQRSAGLVSPIGNQHMQPGQHSEPRRKPGLDYEQTGIDFVLTLEKPCMHHMPWLLERGAEADGPPCGHALMASCPPEPFFELASEVPFGYSHANSAAASANASGVPYASVDFSAAGISQRTWELSKADLNTLLALSAKLNLDGEITPVMAWGMVLAHPRLGEMAPVDFQRLTEELSTKVRCYGFGAVMEEFEVRDAMENVFSTRPDRLALGIGGGSSAYTSDRAQPEFAIAL